MKAIPFSAALEQECSTLAAWKREERHPGLASPTSMSSNCSAPRRLLKRVLCSRGYSLVQREIEDEILLLPEGRNWAIVYSPMASGLLTGAMPCERPASLPKITGAGGMPTLRNQMSHNMALVERMREIANRHKRSVGEVAIAWTLRHSVVPAPSSVPAICARQRESCALASCTSTRSKPLSKPRLDRVRNTGRAGAKGWLTLRDYDLRALLATPFARQLIAVMASKKAPNSFRALL
jgi:aryl-alcohol dehydrogenase-like predicted oxidoreductase